MSHETSPDLEDCENLPEGSEADPSLERQLQQAVETSRQRRQQAELSEGLGDRPFVRASSIEEESLDEEMLEEPHSDLPEPGPPSAVSSETERRLQDAVEAARRRREQAELG